ncbi:hypothetical protein, conserved [Eimeria necatrix]|uniref:Uncharacterized protein n=1 Tax=Eimeria necatrix TaxID=51315 RepID=U6MSR6_9EIME|nr:hypothetical protein, conserved [Eimeria necatrix]CDJ67041.1 hypothetical protein, conserved [Eimeria necatrix]
MARKGPPTPGSLSRGHLGGNSDGSAAGLSEGLPGGPSSQLSSRLALVRYLLYQVRTSRSAYYPESSSVGGAPTSGSAFGHIWGASEKAAGDSAADIAAAGAAGLADALDPSVPVSVLLQSVAVPKLPPNIAASDCPPAARTSPLRGPAAAAAATSWPSWGSLAAATTASASREGYEALELYLCERLLPLLDSALAALCNFVEKLQADTNQYEQQQQHLQQQLLQQQRRRLLHEQQQDDEGEEQQPQVGTELDIQQEEDERIGERQQHQAQYDRDEQPQHPDTNSVEERVPNPRLLLGKGLKARFDPLVWLAQYLLRHSKAADKYEAATSNSSTSSSTAATATATIAVRKDTLTNAKAAAPEAAARVVRGEHLCHSELPLLAAVARQVREERSWRALEAVKPQMQIYIQNYLQQQQQQEQQQHNPQGLQQSGHEGEGEYSQRQQLKDLQRQQEQQQQQQHPEQQQQQQCPLTVEDLHFALQALDALWGLDEQQGLFAAVAGADDETETDPWSLPSSSRGSSHSSRLLLLPLHNPSHTTSANNSNSTSSNGIVGACIGVPLEVADSNNITFPEFWRFVDACLLACTPLKQAAFNYAFQTLANARRQQQQQDKQQQEQRQQEKQQLEKQQLVQQQQEKTRQQLLGQDQKMLQEEAEVESGLSPDVLPSQNSSEDETPEAEQQQQQQQ